MDENIKELAKLAVKNHDYKKLNDLVYSVAFNSEVRGNIDIFKHLIRFYHDKIKLKTIKKSIYSLLFADKYEPIYFLFDYYPRAIKYFIDISNIDESLGDINHVRISKKPEIKKLIKNIIEVNIPKEYNIKSNISELKNRMKSKDMFKELHKEYDKYAYVPKGEKYTLIDDEIVKIPKLYRGIIGTKIPYSEWEERIKKLSYGRKKRKLRKSKKN